MSPDRRLARAVASVSPLLSLLAAHPAAAQSTTSPDGSSEEVVVTGTRAGNRTALESVAPIDVVSSESFRNLGVAEVPQALAASLPSYNFPRPGLADGTDTVRPATLRGLSPDETLVLVNGKRRHSAALVHVNATVGRGAATVDLNTIPTAMLSSIEVLRDGASAQYGSDAIAGVINLRLREDRDGGEAALTYGVRDTSYDVLAGPAPTGAGWGVPRNVSRSLTDGETLTLSMWKGLPLGANGFVTVAAEYRDQEHTERGGFDVRQQYPRVGGAFDPRELTINRFNSWYGEPELEQKTLFVNTGYSLSNGATLYGWASYQLRDVRSAGFIRRALDDRNIISLYPDGFLPIITPEVNDYSAAAGIRWDIGEWNMDTSLVYGLNDMKFSVENSLNRSFGRTSQTEFDAGGLDYDQVVFNISGVRGVDVGFLRSPVNVAVGIEARRESFSITAGERASWDNGGERLPDGTPAPSGAQVFPGFRPQNEVDESRTAVGLYLDLETRFAEKLLTSVAVRGERYSDFGRNVSGKLAARYDFTPMFALRGSVQNGFRAPSLQQQFFATTATNFIGGEAFEITTFPATDPVAAALGAEELDAEEATDFSLGMVLRLGRLGVTVDAYHIEIDDRIVLSENLTQPNVRSYLRSLGFIGVGGGRFFINGVDTTTRGVDVSMNYPVEVGAGRIDLRFAANFNSTEVDRVPQTAPLSALNPSPVLFDRFNVLTFEEGNPESKFTSAAIWSRGRWGTTLRATRYGEVFSPDSAATYATVAANTRPADVVLEPRTLVDLEGRVTLAERTTLAIGAENLFDKYPTPNPPEANTAGTQSFSNYSPFGRSGRFIYARASVSF
jgi:iron complex outermembrane receptor protein